MTEQRHVDRALTLAEIAPHESVTISILAGENGRFSSSSPLHDPPVSYLDGPEAPAFVLANRKRGIGLGSKRNTVSPASGREALVIVTGRRTLCLVGQASADRVIEIPHESVAAAEVNTGFRAHRLALRTPRNIYHCWLNRRTATDCIEAAAAFIEERQPETPEEIESDDNASQVMYRGQPVSEENLPGGSPTSDGTAPESNGESPEHTDSDETTVMYRGRPVDSSAE
jgi:hypothetical protein